MEALKMLEPLVGKLAWTVLRGLGAGNSPRLPYTQDMHNTLEWLIQR